MNGQDGNKDDSLYLELLNIAKQVGQLGWNKHWCMGKLINLELTGKKATVLFKSKNVLLSFTSGKTEQLQYKHHNIEGVLTDKKQLPTWNKIAISIWK